MKIWDSFLETVADKNNLSDYKTYYSVTVQWTKKHIVAMLIGDTLRKMITIKSGTDCPECNNETIFCTSDNKIFLSCDVCSYCTAEKNIHTVLPASMKQISEYHIKKFHAPVDKLRRI